MTLSVRLVVILILIVTWAVTVSGHQQDLLPRYTRSAFRHWIDLDSDCQDTRAELLIERSKQPVMLSRGSCLVLGGLWLDLYTGKRHVQANQFDIDHVVPLAHAWKMGAWQWTAERRESFANDPFNLLIVSRSENRRKGKKGPDEYMPPDETFHREYIERWLAVKLKYNLMLGAEEAVFIVDSVRHLHD